MKKLFYSIVIILLLLSIVHDLNRETTVDYVEPNSHFEEIVHIKVETGDSILSVTNEINKSNTIDTEQILEDFQQLNPGIAPDKLIANQFYYFPLYSINE